MSKLKPTILWPTYLIKTDIYVH